MAKRTAPERVTTVKPGPSNVGRIIGKLKSVSVVASTAHPRKIRRKQGLHPRRLIPRVPTGSYRRDDNPTEAMILDSGRRAEDRPRPETEEHARLAASGAIVFAKSVQLTDVATADTASHVCEPSVAVNGPVVFYTGNWFASLSIDGGTTFRYIDPEHAFPAPAGMPFCCDQVAHYIKKIDTFVWLLQHDGDPSNIQRLAFATTQQIQQGQWRTFDLTPAALGVPGCFLDFPDLALGTNMLYVTTNAYRGSPFFASVVVRIPFTSIKQGKVTAQRFVWTQNFNFRVAQYCARTAYFATHVNSSTLRVFKWPEQAAVPTSRDVGIASWEEGNYSTATPDGHNWLSRADGRMTGACLANGVLYFAWGANRGGASNRPFPYAQIARIKASTMQLLENITLWDPAAAICYAALSTNQSREVGVSFTIAGNARFPTHVVGFLTGTRRQSVTFIGQRGPSDEKWGDYHTVRRTYPAQKQFAATGYVLLNGVGNSDATPNFTVFGRSGDV
jgi:hypothetical protein